MNWRDFITVDPRVCHGTPCFKGARVMVSVVQDSLAAGSTAEEIATNYPLLPDSAVASAIAYAAELARECIVNIRGSAA